MISTHRPQSEFDKKIKEKYKKSKIRKLHFLGNKLNTPQKALHKRKTYALFSVLLRGLSHIYNYNWYGKYSVFKKNRFTSKFHISMQQ